MGVWKNGVCAAGAGVWTDSRDDARVFSGDEGERMRVFVLEGNIKSGGAFLADGKRGTIGVVAWKITCGGISRGAGVLCHTCFLVRGKTKILPFYCCSTFEIGKSFAVRLLF